jgi:hypothetical protein
VRPPAKKRQEVPFNLLSRTERRLRQSLPGLAKWYWVLAVEFMFVGSVRNARNPCHYQACSDISPPNLRIIATGYTSTVLPPVVFGTIVVNTHLTLVVIQF